VLLKLPVVVVAESCWCSVAQIASWLKSSGFLPFNPTLRQSIAVWMKRLLMPLGAFRMPFETGSWLGVPG
jgi:hypothetical protein